MSDKSVMLAAVALVAVVAIWHSCETYSACARACDGSRDLEGKREVAACLKVCGR